MESHSKNLLLHLAARHILVPMFVLELRCNLGLVFLCRSWQSVCFVDIGGDFSGMSGPRLFDGDYRGADWGAVIRLSYGRVVAVAGAAEPAHALSWRLGAVHWSEERNYLSRLKITPECAQPQMDSWANTVSATHFATEINLSCFRGV